ncbi:hypothetical protein BGW39_001855 [Mortierella sp. 14UC]|nr:hypothetical protein BGW39_001855 [Mortierella sp. 14UC]
MLAPADTPTNSTTPGDSSNALMSSRSPQEANYQVDDLSRASENVASSPQYVNDGHSVPSTHTADSPYSRTPSMRHPHVEPSDYSPSVSHPQAYSPSVNQTQAYSPALVSPSLASNYIPPPSPTHSHHSQAYPVPLAYNKAYPTADGTYQQQQYAYQQDPYQQPYQQQPYPEPTLHSYPEPTLVDPVAEKVDQASTISKPVNNGRRKKIIWIGSIVILILIGAIVGLVVAMKSKDSDNSNNNNSSNNSSSGNSTLRTPTTPTTSAKPPPLGPSIPVTLPPVPATTTIAVSSIPVTVPTPGPSSGNRVKAPPLTNLPPKGDCPTFFCNYYIRDCREN